MLPPPEPSPATDPAEPAPSARSLRAAARETAPSAVMNGLTDPFIIPYALALGAGNFETGLLSSIRNLFLSLIQLKSADAVGWCRSRKRLLLWTAGMQAALWFPLAGVSLLGSLAVPALIAGYTIGTAGAALGGPAWGSLLAEHLRPTERGRFFGRRAQLGGVWGTLAACAAGLILQLTTGSPLIGFAALCIVAGCSRWLSFHYLAQFEEPAWHEPHHLRHTFWQFLRRGPRDNFLRFVWCLAALNVATHLASPFFAVFMLRDLHYSYVAYTIVILAGSITGFAASPWWGRIGDVAGNRRVLRWTSLGVWMLPLTWMVSPHPAWMAFTNALGALLWSGINLASANFVYDAVHPGLRTRYLAYFNVLNGCGIALGAFLGGWLSTRLTWWGRPLAALFVVSAAARLLAGLAFGRLVQEVRPVRHVGFRDVVLDLAGLGMTSVMGLFPMRPRPDRRG